MRCTSYTQCRPTHPIPVQCWPASQPIAGSMPVNRIRRWPNIETELSRVCSDCHTGDTLYHSKSHYPDNTIHWLNCEIMLCHRPRRWPTLFQIKTFQAPLTTNIIVNIFFSKDFLNTKLLNLRTSNVILRMFIRTGVQNCQPLPTHPFSPEWDTNSDKINLIGYRPTAGPNYMYVCILYKSAEQNYE